MEQILKEFLEDEFIGTIPREMLQPINHDEAIMSFFNPPTKKEEDVFVASVFLKRLVKKRD